MNFLGGQKMVPRIFLSSTFYDLKYARENLGQFIKDYGFEAIRFECGDVGYELGENLDVSCYSEMADSDMAIVIIGGRYGSPTTDSKIISNSFEKYVSITHREFDTAVKSNIPVFVFVEEAVFSEYGVYKKNKEKLEKPNSEFTFCATDNINIFRFINDIELFPKIPIIQFRTVEDIKSFLRKQWADMFYRHLLYKRQVEPINKMQPSVYDIYNSLQQMELMLKQIGKVTLEENPEIYDDVLKEQKVEYAAGKISNCFEFVSSLKGEEDIKKYITSFVNLLFEAYNQNLLEYPFSDSVSDIEKFISMFNTEQVVISVVKEHLAFENEIFEMDEESKIVLVDKLLKKEYLKKMGFIL